MKQILPSVGAPFLLAIICILALPCSVSQATIVASGNTFLDANGELDGTDNWVVVTVDEISETMRAGFVAGTSSPGFDTGATLIFLYQLSNNGGGTDDIDKLAQSIGGTSSWGYFSGWGLSDGGNAIGISENMGVDTTPDGGGDMRQGGTASFVQGTYVNPTSTTIVGDSLEWYFETPLDDESGVSPLLVSTTRVVLDDPGWVPMSESIHEPGCTWVGGFSNPHVPEPATICLLGLGGLVVLRRQRC